jgi:hypothetical protein
MFLATKLDLRLHHKARLNLFYAATRTFCIYLTLGMNCIYQNDGILKSCNIWVNYDDHIIAQGCLWVAVHKQICLICTSFPLFSELEVVTNMIYKVVIPQMDEDQDDCHVVEGDRDLSFSFLTQKFSHKRGNFGKTDTPVSARGTRLLLQPSQTKGKSLALSQPLASLTSVIAARPAPCQCTGECPALSRHPGPPTSIVSPCQPLLTPR